MRQIASVISGISARARSPLSTSNPHRPLSKDELTRRELLTVFLDKASEDELIEDVLLPLFRQLGFHRITAARP